MAVILLITIRIIIIVVTRIALLRMRSMVEPIGAWTAACSRHVHSEGAVGTSSVLRDDPITRTDWAAGPSRGRRLMRKAADASGHTSPCRIQSYTPKPPGGVLGAGFPCTTAPSAAAICGLAATLFAAMGASG